MKAKEFRKNKYGDQRHLFSDQDQELIDQMMEEYASQKQPEVSEESVHEIAKAILYPIKMNCNTSCLVDGKDYIQFDIVFNELKSALKKLTCPEVSKEEIKIGKRGKYQTIIFPDNEIPFMQDHGFWKGVPSNIKFIIRTITKLDRLWLVAEGYGALEDNPYGLAHKYGNGAICVSMNDLPKSIMKLIKPKEL